ncbi:MAG: cytochrome c [Flavobacteriales bacterium]|nr:cytochrome c [Flavobacteriales bacterium]
MRTAPLFAILGLLACSSTPDGTASTSASSGPLDGAKLFQMQCTLCHGRDGKLGLSGAKDLTVSALTREQMLLLVSNGKGAMMPYKSVMRPEEIEAVVDHVRSLRATP